MNIKYKEYDDEDFNTLCNMVIELYTEDPPEGGLVTVDNVKLTVNEAKKNPSKLKILLFIQGEEILGYSILNFFWSNEHGGDIINIDEIYVKPYYRSKGISSDFVEELPLLCQKSVGIRLEASVTNIRAIKGYERMGFTKSPNFHMQKYPLNRD